MRAQEPEQKPLPRDADGLGLGAQAVDAQTRSMAQKAGLDQDLESQVPPLYGRFSTRLIAGLAILAILALAWTLL